jgi:rsbT antagonist protein RsbS
MPTSGTTSVTGTRVGNCLVVTISQDLSGGMLDEIRRVALNGIQKDGATSAIFELSAVPFMDTQEFKSLRDIARMAAMLGSKVIFVGLNPGIIIHLMASDADVSGMHACLGLDEALQKVQEHDEQFEDAVVDMDAGQDTIDTLGEFLHAPIEQTNEATDSQHDRTNEFLETDDHG